MIQVLSGWPIVTGGVPDEYHSNVLISWDEKGGSLVALTPNRFGAAGRITKALEPCRPQAVSHAKKEIRHRL